MNSLPNFRKDSLLRAIAVSIGIVINVAVSFVFSKLNLPIYMDTMGTIVISALGGAFPGIVTAIMTNLIGSLFNNAAIYFGAVNAAVAIFTSWFVRYRPFKNIRNIFLFIGGAAVICGTLSAIVQWLLIGAPQNRLIAETVEGIASSLKIPALLAFLGVNFLINIIDKSFSVLIALLVLWIIPKDVRMRIWNSGWRQRPLSEEELSRLKHWGKDTKGSMKTRLTLVLLAASIMLMTVMGWIWIQIYFTGEIKDKKETAYRTAKFAASVIDPKRVDSYLQRGRDASGYANTEELLRKIRDNSSGIQYLYVIKIDEKQTTFVFDLDTKPGYEKYETNAADSRLYQAGETIPTEPEMMPYMDDFLQGKEIPPIEIRNKLNWLIATYYPVKDSDGKAVCYVGVDTSVDYVADYLKTYVIRICLIMAGFLILIFACGLWTTGSLMVYPINTIAVGVENLMNAGDDQKALDEAVKELRNYDIQTQDEVEKLYHEVCALALNQAEQLRSIRRFSDSTAKMQDGLILTIADLVEKRDSDTGSHIQKTAGYVKVIVESLQKKGYYAGKITPKFVSDVVRSAPLHDVGKINIPDSVLNKGSELTPEEYEIIKTHTTAGKRIMENAISTVEGENYLKEARNMAAYHHERWDGSGYPEGLHGEVIPLSARIMAVADEFDDLTSKKTTHEPYSFDEAVAMIRDGAGTLYDPKCVEAFMDSLPEIKVIYRKYNTKL